MEEIRQIAARIRELREISDYSPEDVAEKLGIPTAQYLGYETNGEDIPINVLYRLARLYGVDLGEILSGHAAHLDTYCLVKKGRGRHIDRYPGYTFHSLAYTYKHRMMEPLLVSLTPGEPDAALVTHGGQEFNLCLSGTMELLFNGKVLRLEEGDSIYFNPAYPHGQRAVDGPVTFLTVIAE